MSRRFNPMLLLSLLLAMPGAPMPAKPGARCRCAFPDPPGPNDPPDHCRICRGRLAPLPEPAESENCPNFGGKCDPS